MEYDSVSGMPSERRRAVMRDMESKLTLLRKPLAPLMRAMFQLFRAMHPNNSQKTMNPDNAYFEVCNCAMDYLDEIRPLICTCAEIQVYDGAGDLLFDSARPSKCSYQKYFSNAIGNTIGTNPNFHAAYIKGYNFQTCMDFQSSRWTYIMTLPISEGFGDICAGMIQILLPVHSCGGSENHRPMHCSSRRFD